MENVGVLGTNAFMKPTDSIKSDINILMLGESGVGKSTFINAFANYLQYETLEAALNSDLFCLIPTSFTIPDENFEDRIVDFGYDTNEDKEIGNSSTQSTRAYVFPVKGQKSKIRLIDTPGIGDSRGIEQDEKNFENILMYLSQFKEIHAICFLLKPNVTVINAYFKFCIKHLISRLELSASENIVFIFTNSRSTFYKPGSTSRLLKIILDEIKSTPPNVEVPFSKDNMFCMDNEVFKYLVAHRKDIPFGDAEKTAYQESWKKSVESCWSLLNYISGSGGKTGLRPHQIQDTLSVNEARRTVLDLSKPLADITDLIQDNLIILKKHNEHILDDNLSVEELQKSLYIPIINLKQTSLPDPVVVCTSNTCAETCIVSGLKKYHYKEKCCKPCTVSNVQRNIVGSPSLLYCDKFDVNKRCKKCSCDFSMHMHILYETELVEDTIVNESIKKEIKSKEDMLEARFKMVMDLKERRVEFETERDAIVKALAKFAHFLKNNSISSYNDAFEDYIDYLIERENALGSKKNIGIIFRYKFLKKQHVEEKKVLDAVTVDGGEGCIMPKEIQDHIESLYNLKHTGKKVRELHVKQQKVRKNLHEKSMEYCHPKAIEKPSSKKSKKAEKEKMDLQAKFKEMNLENFSVDEFVAEYLKQGKLAGDKPSSSSGAKPKQMKKLNNDEAGNKNEQKDNPNLSKKNINQMKNNIVKANSEDQKPKNQNKVNEPKKQNKKFPNPQNPGGNHPSGGKPQNFPPGGKNQNFQPGGKPQIYPAGANPQNFAAGGNPLNFAAGGNPQNFSPGFNPYTNNFPNQFPQNQFPMQPNQFPMGPNQFPVGPNQFAPQYPNPPNYGYGPNQFPNQPNMPLNQQQHHGSFSNLSQTSSENDNANKQRRARPNNRGKARGDYKNVNQHREPNDASAQQSSSSNKRGGANANKFKKPSGKKNRNVNENNGSDSDDSQASSKRSNRKGGKKADGIPEESLNYEMMKHFLEEQKKVAKDANSKSSSDKKSETVFMMFTRND